MEENFGSITERKVIEGELEYIFTGVKFKENSIENIAKKDPENKEEKNTKCQDFYPFSTSKAGGGGGAIAQKSIEVLAIEEICPKIKELVSQNSILEWYLSDFCEVTTNNDLLLQCLKKLCFEGYFMQKGDFYVKII